MASLKFYNVTTHDEDIVWKQLNRSGKFGWSWCKDTQSLLRHVAIVLYFNGTPFYTINFRTVDGESKAAAVFSEAKPLITIEDAPTVGYEYFPALEEFQVMTEHGNRRAKKRVRAMLSYDPGRYNLFMNNCRDHVTGVVRALIGKELSDSDFDNSMTEIRNQDTIMEVGGAGFGIFGVGLLVAGIYGISRLFTKPKSEDCRENRTYDN